MVARSRAQTPGMGSQSAPRCESFPISCRVVYACFPVAKTRSPSCDSRFRLPQQQRRLYEELKLIEIGPPRLLLDGEEWLGTGRIDHKNVDPAEDIRDLTGRANDLTLLRASALNAWA